MARPRLLKGLRLDQLRAAVGRGQYVRYDDPKEIPEALKPYAYYPGPDEFVGMAILSSSTGENPETIGGVTVPPGEPVYRVRTVRRCDHDGTPHQNADDVLLFSDQEGRPLQISRIQNPSHYSALSTASGLTYDETPTQLPREKSGELSDLSEAGFWYQFST